MAEPYYCRGGRKYCESIGKQGALDTITKDTPLVLKAYIVSKCEWIEQEEREVDQEAEREVGLLGMDEKVDTNKAQKRNRREKSQSPLVLPSRSGLLGNSSTDERLRSRMAGG